MSRSPMKIPPQRQCVFGGSGAFASRAAAWLLAPRVGDQSVVNFDVSGVGDALLVVAAEDEEHGAGALAAFGVAVLHHTPAVAEDGFGGRRAERRAHPVFRCLVR